jgi:hypothetical protein
MTDPKAEEIRDIWYGRPRPALDPARGIIAGAALGAGCYALIFLIWLVAR